MTTSVRKSALSITNLLLRVCCATYIECPLIAGPIGICYQRHSMGSRARAVRRAWHENHEKSPVSRQARAFNLSLTHSLTHTQWPTMQAITCREAHQSNDSLFIHRSNHSMFVLRTGHCCLDSLLLEYWSFISRTNFNYCIGRRRRESLVHLCGTTPQCSETRSAGPRDIFPLIQQFNTHLAVCIDGSGEIRAGRPINWFHELITITWCM